MGNRVRNWILASGLIAVVTLGCNNGGNTDLSYKAAINDHFKAFPVCIWSQPKNFPCKLQQLMTLRPKVMTPSHKKDY
jgi:hypothetical protein